LYWAHDVRNIIDNSGAGLIVFWCMWWQVASWCPMKDILPDEILSSKEIVWFVRMYICELLKLSCSPCLTGSWMILFVEVSFGLSFALSVLYLLLFWYIGGNLGRGMNLGLFVRAWCFLWCIFSLAWWRTEPPTTSLHLNLQD